MESNAASSIDEWITLNVGGKIFATTRKTLVLKEPESMLARMFSPDSQWSHHRDASGAYLIDRSPEYFEPILNYLRHGQMILNKNVNPEGVLEEARFFSLPGLIEQLERSVEQEHICHDEKPITRRELVLRLLGTVSETRLRCQGIDFTGADLSKLDLTFVNFKYATLRHADLRGSNLSNCNFERADLSYTHLDGAKLTGVRLACATLEGASMLNCDFEDPSQMHRANMEGTNMKFVNMEGSLLTGANLRIANLKNAILRNCNLRGAVLAGADLENCDLSGCDLTEANLRGANIKDASFTFMVHPIHMAHVVTPSSGTVNH